MYVRRAACALVLGLSLSACGSTVQQGRTTAVDSLAEPGAAGADAFAAPEGAGAPIGTSGSGSSSGSGATGGPSGGLGPVATGSGDQTAPTTGPAGGTTGAGPRTVAAGSGPVAVGIEYVDAGGGAAAAGAIGAKGVSAGDQKAEYTVLIDDVNRRGGLLGRKVVPVWFAYDPAGSSLSTQEQAMCARFTQDNKVFAALILPISTDTAHTCLERAGVTTIAQGLGSTVDDGVFAKYPHYLTAGSLNLSRLPDAWTASLARQGYFSKDAKIGVVSVDSPPFVRTMDGALTRALAKYGQKIAERAVVPSATTISDLSQQAPAVQSAVLQFASAGVNRVLFLEVVGGTSLLFLQAADSQGYRPRYGVTTNEELFKLKSQAPASQLVGAVGIGWFPLYDVAAPDAPLSSAAKNCLALMRAHGVSIDDQNASSIAQAICDHINVLVTSTRLGGAVQRDRVLRGLDSAGTSIETAAHFRFDYHGRRDGTAAVRDLAYLEACSCFRYAGPLQPA